MTLTGGDVCGRVTIDWRVRESARARSTVMGKRILNKYGDPPDSEEVGGRTVRRQAELLCAEDAAPENTRQDEQEGKRTVAKASCSSCKSCPKERCQRTEMRHSPESRNAFCFPSALLLRDRIGRMLIGGECGTPLLPFPIL
jgi:hypothetical protein